MSEDDGKNGSAVGDLTVRVLRDIREDLRGIHEEIRGTNRRVEAGFGEVNSRLDRLSLRIDNVLLGPMGESVRDLGSRVASLEAWRDEIDPK